MESVAVLQRSVVEVGLHGVDRNVEVDRRKRWLDEELQFRQTDVNQSPKLAIISLESVIIQVIHLFLSQHKQCMPLLLIVVSVLLQPIESIHSPVHSTTHLIT